MADFNDYKEPTPTNSYIIQRALREIDTVVLATALIGLPAIHRDMFYRNMSQRVVRICEEEIELRDGSTSEHQVEDAKSLLLDLLERMRDRVDPNEVRETVSLPKINLGTHEEIIDTFRVMAGYIRRSGHLSLQNLEDQVDDPLMRKGIQFLVDGVEHMLMHSLLERYKRTLLRDLETRYDMILDGIETLGTGYTPQMVEEKLRTHIPS